MARVARQTATYIGVPFYRINLIEVFNTEVAGPFLDYYSRGITPNPCVMCNSRIRFGVFLDRLRDMGFDRLATGHYARIVDSRIHAGYDDLKDQSYFLHAIPRERLASIMFPLGEMLKKDVKRMAAELKLPARVSSESQDSCILMNKSLSEFVRDRLGPVPGDIVDKTGKLLGRHNGYQNYTIGQRRGLGGLGSRMYVMAIDPEANRVIAGPEEELYSRDFCVKLREPENFDDPLSGSLKVKIRYRHEPASCRIMQLDNSTGICSVSFDEPQRSVTPGQSAVFYRKDMVAGGGEIMPPGKSR
jgi:tRNA-specific 2-thiouridylase